MMMRLWKRLKDRRYLPTFAGLAIILLVLTAFTTLRAQEGTQNVTPQPTPVHIDQVAKLAREGNVRALALTGDIVTARLTDGSLVTARKEYQV
jgi:hypothetical protein